jgi:hypothetical protein
MQKTIKRLFFIAAAATGVAAAVLLTQGNEAPAIADPMPESAQMVRENMAQPCAADRAQQSVMMLTELGMTCK